MLSVCNEAAYAGGHSLWRQSVRCVSHHARSCLTVDTVRPLYFASYTPQLRARPAVSLNSCQGAVAASADADVPLHAPMPATAQGAPLAFRKARGMRCCLRSPSTALQAERAGRTGTRRSVMVMLLWGVTDRVPLGPAGPLRASQRAVAGQARQQRIRAPHGLQARVTLAACASQLLVGLGLRRMRARLRARGMSPRAVSPGGSGRAACAAKLAAGKDARGGALCEARGARREAPCPSREVCEALRGARREARGALALGRQLRAHFGQRARLLSILEQRLPDSGCQARPRSCDSGSACR